MENGFLFQSLEIFSKFRDSTEQTLKAPVLTVGCCFDSVLAIGDKILQWTQLVSHFYTIQPTPRSQFYEQYYLNFITENHTDFNLLSSPYLIQIREETLSLSEVTCKRDRTNFFPRARDSKPMLGRLPNSSKSGVIQHGFI